MPGHFASIGFDVQQSSDLDKVLGQVLAGGTTMDSSQGMYIVWKTPEGIEMWANGNSDGEMSGCTPYFAGESKVQVTVGKMHCWDDEWPLEGGLIGALGPDLDGDYPPIAIDLPDYDLARIHAERGSTWDVRVAAFAHDMNYYSDEQAFRDAQTEEPRWAPISYIPTGLFFTETRKKPIAEAVFAGPIQETRIVVNSWSGKQFYHLVVKSLPGVLDVVAEMELLPEKPVVGGIVHGEFWLSGRLLDE
jgi:hypothetical protein